MVKINSLIIHKMFTFRFPFLHTCSFNKHEIFYKCVSWKFIYIFLLMFSLCMFCINVIRFHHHRWCRHHYLRTLCFTSFFIMFCLYCSFHKIQRVNPRKGEGRGCRMGAIFFFLSFYTMQHVYKNIRMRHLLDTLPLCIFVNQDVSS